MDAAYTWAKKVIPFVGLALAVLFPFITSQSQLAYLIPALIWGIAAIGWTAIFRTGQFSMGQGAFMLIGGYASAIFTATMAAASGVTSTMFHFPVLVGMLIGGIIAGIIAFLLGLITLKLGGLFFAIVTLAFGELLRVAANNLPKITGAVNGITVKDPAMFGINFSTTRIPFYFLTLAALIITAVVFRRIDKSRLGRLFRSVSSNPYLASHSGLYLMKYRVMAFTIAGVFAGIAGALYVHYLRIVSPGLFGFSESVMILIMCTVGGVRSPVMGAVVGALILSPVGDYLTTRLQGAKPLVFGILVVAVAFYLIGGITSVPDMIRRYFVRRTEARQAEAT